MSLPPLWPHQEQGIEDYFDALIAGHRRVCLTSPTGGGKTRTVAEIAKRYLAQGKKVVWYTNRKMLLEQTAVVLDDLGITVGKRASGHLPELLRNFQVSSVQTERSRTLNSDKWELHEADLAIFDEAHLMANDTCARLMGRHIDGGAVILGVTATPLDLGDFYDELIVAGTNSECRACGALVSAHHYGPDEPDLKQIGTMTPGEDVSEGKNRKLMGSVEFEGDTGSEVTRLVADDKIKALFGRVIDWWKELNPCGGKRTLGFAPGVRESLWFAMQFEECGIPSAHIDGEDVWVDGELHRSNKGVREDVIRDFRRGRIQTLWNRFVLREGIDIPEVEHMILACVIGSLQSYIQIGGRGLRACKRTSKEACVIQDHGGNWWRHGSLNIDRDWELSMDSRKYAAERIDRMREKIDREPVLCPQCKRVLNRLNCPCGFVLNPTAKTRPVIQADGQLVEHRGDIFPARRRQVRADTHKLWTQMYCRAYQGGMTFRQAEALFCKEHFYYPPRDLPLMPRMIVDWGNRVRTVETNKLIGPYPAWLHGWREKRASTTSKEELT